VEQTVEQKAFALVLKYTKQCPTYGGGNWETGRREIEDYIADPLNERPVKKRNIEIECSNCGYIHIFRISTLETYDVETNTNSRNNVEYK
jgi:hypothetical protein